MRKSDGTAEMCCGFLVVIGSYGVRAELDFQGDFHLPGGLGDSGAYLRKLQRVVRPLCQDDGGF